jgi:hypothetical protein
VRLGPALDHGHLDRDDGDLFLAPINLDAHTVNVFEIESFMSD